RLLRASVTIGTLGVLASTYLSAFLALNPDFRLPLQGRRMLIGAIVPMMILATVAGLRLRAEGLDGRSILAKAFQQPRCWRSWYPRALRRRGDVWSRLPREIRRFRLSLGFYQ